MCWVHASSYQPHATLPTPTNPIQTHPTPTRLVAFLKSEDGLGFESQAQVGSLLRQAPWLLQANLDFTVKPVLAFLRNWGVQKLDIVVRAYPQVLLADVKTELGPRLEFLLEIGMRESDVPNVVQSFPLLLGLDVNTRMRPVVWYLLDLGQ